MTITETVKTALDARHPERAHAVFVGVLLEIPSCERVRFACRQARRAPQDTIGKHAISVAERWADDASVSADELLAEARKVQSAATAAWADSARVKYDAYVVANDAARTAAYAEAAAACTVQTVKRKRASAAAYAAADAAAWAADAAVDRRAAWMEAAEDLQQLSDRCIDIGGKNRAQMR